MNAFVMKLAFVLLSLFIFVGCGTNNSQTVPEAPVVDTNVSTAPAVLALYGGDRKTVTEDAQTLNITIQAWTKSNTPAEGAIIAQAMESDGKNGKLTPANVSLVSGLATFTYTAPDNLQAEIDANNTETSFRFYSDSNDVDPVTVTILFNTKVTDQNLSDAPAVLAIYGGGSKTVAENGQVISITVQAWTQENTPAEGIIAVQVLENDGKNGMLTPSTVELENGLATFTYTAPQNLQAEIDSNNTGTIFSFFSKTNEIEPVTATIRFDTTATGETTGNPIAKLEVINGSTTLTGDGESINVQVLAKDKFGYAVKGGTVRVKYPANAVKVGIFGMDEVPVGANGIAAFSYTGPAPIYYGYAQFTFEYKEDPNYSTTWSVSFVPLSEPQEPQDPVYPIVSIAATEDIVANTDAYTKTIEVIALMSGNLPAPSGFVSVVYPADVKTKNIGYFTPAKAEILNGKATFTYTGPTPLVSEVEQYFTFRATNYPSASDTVKVSYVPTIDPTSPIAQTLIVVNDDDNNVANGKLIEITKNSEVVKVKVRVYGADNNPFTGGNVRITYPSVAVDGKDVGSFASLSVPCVNGEAEFTYTAPADLKGRSDSFAFTFYHDSTNSPASQSLTMRMNPSGNQLVLANYEIVLAAANGNFEMNLESGRSFTASVIDDKGNNLTQDANYIITNDYTTFADINDTIGVGATPNLTIVGFSVNFSVTTKRKSGTFPIKVSATFTDINGQVKTISAIFNITIFSGPPTAMSISYVETGQDKEHSQFIEVMSVKLTDKYNNPVNTRPMIHFGAIAGYAKDPSQYPQIKAAVDAMVAIPSNADYPTSKLYNGNMIALRNDAKVDNYLVDQAIISLKQNTLGGVSTSYNLTGLDVYNNTIVLFGDGYVYHKSGKWDLASVDGADKLIVNEKFEGTSPNFDMGFAIGNNFRQDTCQFGQEWVLTTESNDFNDTTSGNTNATELDNGNYRVDESGYARVKLYYDYYLAGKDVVVYANLLGDVLGAPDNTFRVGEAQKVTLRGHGLFPVPVAYTIPANSPLSSGYTFEWMLKDTVEWYRNANFGGFEIKVSGQGAYCTNPVLNDYRHCGNEGVAYISYSCAGGAQDGTVTMSDAIVSAELQY